MRSRVLCRRPIWVAWYPRRGRRVTVLLSNHLTHSLNGRYHLTVAVGPLYFGAGPGIPLP